MGICDKMYDKGELVRDIMEETDQKVCVLGWGKVVARGGGDIAKKVKKG